MREPNVDVYFKKEIALQYDAVDLRLRVSQDLFSSHTVDEGTRLLLRSLAATGRAFARALDVGCGYGAIGLALRQSRQAAAVHMVDRDALAVSYARQNAQLNNIDGAEAYASLGYDDATAGDFDLIASNIPAKAGQPVIASLLLDAERWLRPGGLEAVVVVDDIAADVDQVLRASPRVRIVHEKTTRAYTIFHYEFDAAAPGRTGLRSAFERGVYAAGVVPLLIGSEQIEIETAHGLAEAAGPKFGTELLVEAVSEASGERLLAINPGQGYAPTAAAALHGAREVMLAGRDLLALRVTKANLARNGVGERYVRLAHGVSLDGVDGEYDLIVAGLREEEGPAAIEHTIDRAGRLLSPAGRMLIAAPSTPATRLERSLNAAKVLRVDDRRRKKGQSVLTVSRRIA